MVIDAVGALPALDALAPRSPWEGVLLADPRHFDVTYVINPHMAGQVGRVNRDLACEQWRKLADTYRRLNYPVYVLDPVEGLPDLVFIANQSFPAKMPDGRWVAVMSRMYSEHRQPEVAHVEAWYRIERNAETMRLPNSEWAFEGHGDARWHPGRALLYVGHGFRTERPALDALAAMLERPVVSLPLTDPNFYHLDTCLCPLSEEVTLVVEEAFSAEGLALIRHAFREVIPVPYDEAMHFAANGNCPDARHFIVQEGSPTTCRRVEAAGFEVIELDTSEFLKSGGSVYCMTMMLP